MEDRSIFETSIRRFIDWLDSNGTAGYDPYDVWSTRYGTKARRLYYRYGSGAALISAPLVLAERIMPGFVRAGLSKKPYATSHAHLILAYLNLHDSDFDNGDGLTTAISLADELDRMKITGYSGDCWGYPFDWENRRGLWPKNTPLITVTPYCFEAYVKLYEVTGDELYLERAKSITRFALHDLNDIPQASGAIASSYSPLDTSLIVNASAYCAFVLISAGIKLDDATAMKKGESVVKFVLESQRDDGSWPYALGPRGDEFVDHFHTCFVLKNLAKIDELQPDEAVWRAIEKGYSYYEQALFGKDGLPKPFAEGGHRLLKYNLYDFAEAINLGILLREQLPQAFERSRFVARSTVDRFQLEDGHFLTAVGRTGLADKLAFIRWPQAQLFHALTSMWKVLN